jgi:thiol-disulfide isomerase/thioredoxin
MHTALLITRILLAAVLALAAVTKLLDRPGSRQALIDFGAPGRIATPLATSLPLAELATAGALLPARTARLGAIAALALLTAFAGAIARSMIRGEAPDCHCFGQLHSAPAGWPTLARNVLLGGAAVFVLAGGWHDAGPSAIAWIGHLDEAGTVALAGGAGLALVAGASAAFMVALLRQQGRLLLRIDELEARLDQGGVAAATPVPDQRQQGLPVGQQAPGFSLSGLYSETVTLEALIAADKPVLLVFTDPGCGPCNALLPQIAQWQEDHATGMSIAVITRGTADDNRAKAREHGVGGVWLDSDLAVYNAYQVPGTPAAMIVDAQGRIATHVACGAEEITALVDQATRQPFPVVQARLQPQPHAQPPPPPAPLPVGADAPSVKLPDLTGKRIRLTAKGRDTLAVFWNPGCGFCQQMLDELRTWEADPPPGAPRLVLVSTGSVEDNEAMGLRAPILLDQDFATGIRFGATGTPSAILVDGNGRIASQLAVGAPGVMALARAERAAARSEPPV